MSEDLSYQQRQQLKDAVQTQLGREQYERLRDQMGEDRLLQMVLESMSEAAPEPKRESAWVRAFGWPLSLIECIPGVGGGFWGGLLAIGFAIYWLVDSRGTALLCLLALYVLGVVWEGVVMNICRALRRKG